MTTVRVSCAAAGGAARALSTPAAATSLRPWTFQWDLFILSRRQSQPGKAIDPCEISRVSSSAAFPNTCRRLRRSGEKRRLAPDRAEDFEVSLKPTPNCKQPVERAP